MCALVGVPIKWSYIPFHHTPWRCAQWHFLLHEDFLCPNITLSARIGAPSVLSSKCIFKVSEASVIYSYPLSLLRHPRTYIYIYIYIYICWQCFSHLVHTEQITRPPTPLPTSRPRHHSASIMRVAIIVFACNIYHAS